MVQNSQKQRILLLEYSMAWDQILDLVFIPFYFVSLTDVMNYFPTLICWIFIFPFSAVYRIYSTTGLCDPVGEALPSNASFCTDPWMSRLFPPPPFFMFLIQHPLVPTYVPHASFVLPGLTEFSDVGACSKGRGLALAKLFLCCRLLWYRQVCPVCNCTWDGCVFWEALACGAGGCFSPGHAAVGVGHLELQGRISTQDWVSQKICYCGHRIAWQVEESWWNKPASTDCPAFVFLWVGFFFGFFCFFISWTLKHAWLNSLITCGNCWR